MILVVGATGLLGGRIAHQLLQQREGIRILMRPNSPFQALAAAGAQPVFADLKEASSLAEALTGVDTIITTATAGQRDGDDTIERVDLAGNQSLIEAAENAGVRQFIFVSTLASDPASPVPIFRAKGLVEERLRQSSMIHTILRCNSFLEILPPLIVGIPLQQGRPVLLIGEGRRKHSFVAQQDVSAFAVAAIGHPAARNRTIAIGGAAPLSWREIVATAERVLERPIPVETLAPGELLPGLPPLVSEMMAVLESFDSPIDMRETAQTFGITLTSLEAWMRSTFVPILA
jgi:NADH dehydrogenase